MPQETEERDTFIYITLSPATQKLFDENEVDLLKVLQREGIAAGRSPAPASGPEPDRELKSTELIILVPSVAVPLVAAGISRIIDAIGRNVRPVVKARSWKPAVTKDGKPILDASGNPKMAWEETPTLLEPKETREEIAKVKPKAKILGFEVELRDAPRK